MPGLTGPVSFSWSVLVGAGGTSLPLDGWQYEFAPQNVMLEVMNRATAVGLTFEVTAGGDTIVQQSPIQSGGTAGITPSPLNTPVVTGRAFAGQRLRVFLSNPTGGAQTVDGSITLIPAGGKRR